MESEAPTNIYGDHKDIYDELVKEGPFKEFRNHQVFLMAVSLGYEKGEKSESKDSDAITRTQYLGDENSDMWWLIKSVAIDDTGDITVLRDKKKMINIAIEYANEGIEVLDDIVNGDDSFGSLDKNLESKMRERLEEATYSP